MRIKWKILAFESLFIICIVLIHAITWRSYLGPLFVDEIGYLTNAATIKGYDWSGVAKYIPYYGYGVALFIEPLMIIFKDPKVLYTSIRIAFLLLAVVIYFLSLRLINEIDGKHKIIHNFVAVSVACSPILITYKNFVLSEVLIVFVYFLLLIIFAQYEKTDNWIYLLALLFLSFYLVMIHLRCIAVLIALIIVLLLKEIKQKNIYKILFILMYVCIGIIILIWLKGYFQDKTLLGTVSLGNSISDQKDKIRYLLSAMGDLILSSMVKLWTILVAYVGLPLLGAVFLLSKIRNKQFRYIYVLLLLTFVLSFAINCAYITFGNRLDSFFYIRYSEYTIVPLYAIGVIGICDSNFKEKWWILVIVIILQIAMYIVALEEKNGMEMTRCLSICMPEVYVWKTQKYINYILATKVVTLLLLICNVIGNKKKEIYICALIILIQGMWCYSAKLALIDNENENTLPEVLGGYSDEVSIIRNCNAEKIVIITDDSWNHNYSGAYIQFQLPKQKIETWNEEEFFEMSDDKIEDIIYVVPNSLCNDISIENWQMVEKTKNYIFIK